MILPKFGRPLNRLGWMSVLVAVVDVGSLSAAARRLDMPLATVTLESHSGPLAHASPRELANFPR